MDNLNQAWHKISTVQTENEKNKQQKKKKITKTNIKHITNKQCDDPQLHFDELLIECFIHEMNLNLLSHPFYSNRCHIEPHFQYQ